MSRYYSQPYEPLDDPDWNPRASTEELGSYEPYRSHAGDHDDGPLNREGTAYQQPVPSAYVNSRYPPKGIKGLKSKHWDTWTGRKKLIVVGAVVLALIIIIAIVVGVSVEETTKDDFSYTQSFDQVTNPNAFTSGAARKEVPQSNHNGTATPKDTYTYYSGSARHFPSQSEWVSFQHLWSNNLATIQGSCQMLGDGENDTPEQIEYIHAAIQNRSSVSLVDHRFILAVVLQESGGCVHVGQTKSVSGVSNPGLMQSHGGASFSSSNEELSVLAMIQDGTQGTSEGDGLVQLLNKYGNLYEAARVYNSGQIPGDGNLSGASGGNPCYASDIANRLTGWTTAPNECPGEKIT